MDILLVSERTELFDVVSIATRTTSRVQIITEPGALGETCELLSPATHWFDLIIFDLSLAEGNLESMLPIVTDANQAKGIPLLYLVAEEKISDAVKMISNAGDGYLVQEQLASTLQANASLYQRWGERAKRLTNAEEGLSNSSLIDSVTQLPNARSFEQEMVRTWCQLKREKQPMSLILMNIDGFDHYLQAKGDEAANETLRIVALLVDGSLSRPLDTAAHLGGSELAVLLPNTGKEGALKVAQVAMRHIREAELVYQGGKESRTVTVSMAVVSFSFNQLQSNNTSVLLAIAQQKLTQVKEKGSNIIESFEFDDAIQSAVG